jgi:hypothetical protein
VTTIRGTLQEDQLIFSFAPCSVLIEMRNVSDIILEKIKTKIVCLKPLFLKAMPFMGYCEKLWYVTARGHRRQCNMAHARCVLDNEGYRHTHTHTNYVFNTTALHGENSTRTHRNVTLYAHSCFVFLSLQLFLFCLVCLLKVIT